jgi:hypothetical protein
MNTTKFLLTVLTCTGLFTAVSAQIPSYLPANGLAAWWPFNGNGNDGSGNNNHGTVNGATPTTDRFGNANSAYEFDGINDYIRVLSSTSLEPATQISFMAWVKPSGSGGFPHILTKNFGNGHNSYVLNYIIPTLNYSADVNSTTSYTVTSPNAIQTTVWTHVLCTYDGATIKLYENGTLVGSKAAPNALAYSGNPLFIAASNDPNLFSGVGYVQGKLDDIAIWNRALTAEEVTTIYKSCNATIASQPVSALSAKGGQAQFSASAPATAALQWQSNPSGFGWMNVPANATYSGVTTNTLTVNNIQLNNHLQPFRLISSTNVCADTSHEVMITVADTCLELVFDTVHVTVTDTIIINAYTALNTNEIESTIKIYPNPATDRITIDYGNYQAMNGYALRIVDMLGRQLFTGTFSQPFSYIDVSTWSRGVYFVMISDAQENTVYVRKILVD